MSIYQAYEDKRESMYVLCLYFIPLFSFSLFLALILSHFLILVISFGNKDDLRLKLHSLALENQRTKSQVMKSGQRKQVCSLSNKEGSSLGVQPTLPH